MQTKNLPFPLDIDLVITFNHSLVSSNSVIFLLRKLLGSGTRTRVRLEVNQYLSL